MTFDEYLERALEKDEELKEEFIALQPEYRRLAEQLQAERSLQANCTASRYANGRRNNDESNCD